MEKNKKLMIILGVFCVVIFLMMININSKMSKTYRITTEIEIQNIDLLKEISNLSDLSNSYFRISSEMLYDLKTLAVMDVNKKKMDSLLLINKERERSFEKLNKLLEKQNKKDS